MAYDHERYVEIQNMEFGDLVHTMLSNYNPDIKKTPGFENDHPSFQNQEYFWAWDQLNDLCKCLKE